MINPAVLGRLAMHHPETVTIAAEQTVITRRPLLTDLEEAGTASMASRSGSVAGPKMPIDADAVQLAGRIRSDLQRDLMRLGKHRFKMTTLAELTRKWWDAYHRDSPGGAEIAVWIAQLEAWEAEIRALIEPEKRMPVMGEPCPICGSTRAHDGDDSTVALWIAFHEDAPERTTRLECKACKEVLAAGSKAVAATLRVGSGHPLEIC